MRKSSQTIPSNLASDARRFPSPLRLILGIVLCGGFLFLLIYACRASIRNLYRQNRSFELQKIDIAVENELLRRSVESTLAACGIQPYETLLPEMDLENLRQTLLENPRFADAKLRRIFPDTLCVEVEPRLPVAVLRFPNAVGKQELLLDQDGTVIPRDMPGNTSKLPSIIGIKNPEAFKEGETCNDRGIQAFLTFLRESQLRPEGSQYEIVNVRLDEKNERMFLTLEASGVFKSGAQVVLPLENVPQEMDRLNVVVELRSEANETISYINATYQNIPVKP